MGHALRTGFVKSVAKMRMSQAVQCPTLFMYPEGNASSYPTISRLVLLMFW